jgi:hypothetical protein
LKAAATIASGPISKPRAKKPNVLRSFTSAMLAAMAALRSQTPGRRTWLGRLKRWGRATKVPGSIGTYLKASGWGNGWKLPSSAYVRVDVRV